MNKKENNQNKGNQSTNASENAFATLLRNYEQATRNGNNEKESIELCTACAYSVLKKCIDVSQSKPLQAIKRDIARDNNHLNAIANCNTNCYTLDYNQDGDLIQRIKDNTLHQAFDKLVRERLGDGLDLVHDAWIALTNETNKTDKQGDFLEIPYTVRRLKKRVYIKLEDSVNGWEEVETIPIIEVFKAIRQSIYDNGAITINPSNQYSYLEDYALDEERNATEERIYKRLPKCADLGGYVTDYNGANTFYTVDEQSVDDIDALIEQLELSVQQAKVLQLRLRGCGQEAIATYLGVGKGNIYNQLKRIRDKAINNGIQPK